MVATASRTLTIEQLPAEIILDVFSRLPAESVIRCTSVCRSWRSLLHLNNHHFSKLHLHQQQQNRITNDDMRNQFADFIIQFHPDGDGIVGQQFEFLQFRDHDDNDNGENQAVVNGVAAKNSILYRVRKVDHRLMIDYRYYTKYICPERKYFVGIIGSCNGLVCLGCRGDPTYICNPVTSEYVQIPRHEEYYDRNNHWFSCRIVSGFGYHPGIEEYKVVRIYYRDNDYINKDCEGQVQVYTVGKDRGRWRNKEPISHQLDRFSARGVLVNGTLYWISSIRSNPRENIIVAFDLAREEFYQVAKVPQAVPSYGGLPRIHELGGCLSIVYHVAQDSTDVWMMKKNSCTTRRNNNDNEEYSWVKEFTIPQNWNHCDIFALTKNGDLLAWYSYPHELREIFLGKRKRRSEVFLVSYSQKTGNFKRYADESNATRTTIKYLNGTIPHIKSFVSLKDLGEEDATRVRKLKMTLKRKASSCLNLNVFSED